MFERFSGPARGVVVLANEEARLLGHSYIGTEHILLGLIRDQNGAAARALGSLGVRLDAVRQRVDEIIGQGGPSPSGHIPFTPRAKKVLELALREALQLGHNYIGTEHLLLGLLREGEGVACQVLTALGVDLAVARARVVQMLSEDAGGSSEALSGEDDEDRIGVLLSGKRMSATEFASAYPYAERRTETLVFRRFTSAAWQVVILAESEAVQLGTSEVGAVHLLLGVLAESEGAGARALATVGLTLDETRRKAEQHLGRRVSGGLGELTLLPDGLDMIEYALFEAFAAGSATVDTEHLLLGFLHLAEQGDGLAREALEVLGTSADAVREAVAGRAED
jgi:ATP-dependent Clp protease ATP-binding subunit ClpA